jgi:hypothetical protein
VCVGGGAGGERACGSCMAGGEGYIVGCWCVARSEEQVDKKQFTPGSCPPQTPRSSHTPAHWCCVAHNKLGSTKERLSVMRAARCKRHCRSHSIFSSKYIILHGYVRNNPASA